MMWGCCPALPLKAHCMLCVVEGKGIVALDLRFDDSLRGEADETADEIEMMVIGYYASA